MRLRARDSVSHSLFAEIQGVAVPGLKRFDGEDRACDPLGGRPKALDEADLKKAQALLRSGEYSKVQVAHELEVSRHTLWRALSLLNSK